MTKQQKSKIFELTNFTGEKMTKQQNQKILSFVISSEEK